MKSIFNQIERFNGCDFEVGKPFNIVLEPKHKKEVVTPIRSNTPRTEVGDEEVEITVKEYMTLPSTPTFDFMETWNNNIPMPMRTMRGKKLKETRGMVYMDLHGFGEPTIRCRICQRVLTNEISKKYGIGPICLDKIGIDLDMYDVDNIQKRLREMKWSGWIIKSAITSQKPV